MEDNQDLYYKKFNEMQKTYIPYLEQMISKLKKSGDNKSRPAHLENLESLHSLLTNPNKKLKLEILEKSEKVLLKLSEIFDKNESPQREQIINKPLDVKSNDESLQMNSINLKLTAARVKLSKTCELPPPASPSPPPVLEQLRRPVPILIPTERKEERRSTPIIIPTERKETYNSSRPSWTYNFDSTKKDNSNNESFLFNRNRSDRDHGNFFHGEDLFQRRNKNVSSSDENHTEKISNKYLDKPPDELNINFQVKKQSIFSRLGEKNLSNSSSTVILSPPPVEPPLSLEDIEDLLSDSSENARQNSDSEIKRLETLRQQIVNEIKNLSNDRQENELEDQSDKNKKCDIKEYQKKNTKPPERIIKEGDNIFGNLLSSIDDKLFEGLKKKDGKKIDKEKKEPLKSSSQKLKCNENKNISKTKEEKSKLEIKKDNVQSNKSSNVNKKIESKEMCKEDKNVSSNKTSKSSKTKMEKSTKDKIEKCEKDKRDKNLKKDKDKNVIKTIKLDPKKETDKGLESVDKKNPDDASSKDKKYEMSKSIDSAKQETSNIKNNNFVETTPDHKKNTKIKTSSDKLIQNVKEKNECPVNCDKNTISDKEKNNDQHNNNKDNLSKNEHSNTVMNVTTLNENDVKKNISVDKQKDEVKKEIVMHKENEMSENHFEKNKIEKSILTNSRICNNLGDKDERVYVRLADKYNPHPRRNSDNEKPSKSIDTSPSFNITGRGLTMREIERFSQGANTHDTLVSPTPSNDSNTSHGSSHGVNTNDPRVKKPMPLILSTQSPNMSQRLEEQTMFERRFRQDLGNRQLGPTQFNAPGGFETQNQFYNASPRIHQGNFNRFSTFRQNFQGGITPQMSNSFSGCMTPQDPFSTESYGNVGMQNHFDRRSFGNLNQMNMQNVSNNQNVFHKNISQIQYDLAQIGPIDYFDGNQQHFFNEVGPSSYTNSNNLAYGNNTKQNPNIIQNTNIMQNSNINQHNSNNMQNNLQRQINEMQFNSNIVKPLMSPPYSSTLPSRPYGRGPPPHNIPSLFSVKPMIETSQLEQIPRTYAEHRNRREFATKLDAHVLENSDSDPKSKITEKRFRGYDPRPTPRPKKVENGSGEDSGKHFKIPKLKRNDDIEEDDTKEQNSDDVQQSEEVSTEKQSGEIEVLETKNEEKVCENVKNFDDSTQNPEITSNTNDNVDTTNEIKKEDLVNDFIKKLCESGNTNVFFEVLEKLGETFTSKKYKRIQKIMQSDSEESSNEDEKLSEIKTKHEAKKKIDLKEKVKDNVHNNENKKNLETQTLFETVGERIKIGRARRNQTKNVYLEDEKESEISNNDNKKWQTSKRVTRNQDTNLDVSTEEIRDIFICDGVLTTTGKKMCKLLKDNNEHIDIHEADDKKDSFPMTRSCASSMSEALTALVDMPERRTRLPRVVLEKTDLTKLQKCSVSEPGNSVDDSKVALMKSQIRKGGKCTKISKQSKKGKIKIDKNVTNEAGNTVDQSIALHKPLAPIFINRNLKICISLSPSRKYRRGKILEMKINDVLEKLSHNINTNEFESEVIHQKSEKQVTEISKKNDISKTKPVSKKRGKKRGWKAGVIKKKWKKKSTNMKKNKVLDAVLKSNETNESEIKPDVEMKSINISIIDPNLSSIQDTNHENANEKLKPNEKFNIENEVDKNYCYTGFRKYTCKLCKFNGKTIVLHYAMSHPDSEVLISRLTEPIADICIKQSIEKDYDNYKQEEELLHCIEYRRKRFVGFICRFCNVLIKNEFTETFFDHLTTHTGEYRYGCFQCSSVASTRPSIRAHIGQKHPDQKNRPAKILYESSKNVPIVFGYLCSVCNFTQMQKNNIEKHIKTYHCDEEVRIYKINLSSIGNEVCNGEKDEVCAKNSNQEIMNENSSDNSEEKSEVLNNYNKNEIKDSSVEVVILQMSAIKDDMIDKKSDTKDKMITEESKRDEPSKETDMTVFMCTEEIEEDDQKIQEERLKKMEQIIETIGKPRRRTINFVDKLKSKLASAVSSNSEEEVKNIIDEPHLKLNFHEDSNPVDTSQKLNTNKTKDGGGINHIVNIDSVMQKCPVAEEENIKSDSLTPTKTSILEKTVAKNVSSSQLCEFIISEDGNSLKKNSQPKVTFDTVTTMLINSGDKRSIMSTSQKSSDEKDETKQIEITETTTDSRKLKQNDPSNWKAKKSKTAILDTIQRLANVVKQNKMEEQITETNKNIPNPPPLVYLKELISINSKEVPSPNSLIVTVGPVSARKTESGILYYCSDNYCCFSSDNDSRFLKHIQFQHSTEPWDGECIQCDVIIKSFSGKTMKTDAYNHLMSAHVHSLDPHIDIDFQKNSSNLLMSVTDDTSGEKDHESSLPASLPKKPLIRMRRLSGDILSKPVVQNTSLNFTTATNDAFECDTMNSSKEEVNKMPIVNVKKTKISTSGGNIGFQKNKNSNVINDFMQSNDNISSAKEVIPLENYQHPVNELFSPIMNNSISNPSAIQICDVRSLSIENEELNSSVTKIQPFTKNANSSVSSKIHDSLYVETENLNSIIPPPLSFNSSSKPCSTEDVTKTIDNLTTDVISSSMLCGVPTPSTIITVTAPNFKTQIPIVLDKQLILHPPKDLKLLPDTSKTMLDNTCTPNMSESFSSNQIDTEKNQTTTESSQLIDVNSKSSIYIGGEAELKDPEVLSQMLTGKRLCKLFKCMIRTCAFTTDSQYEFVWHIKNKHNVCDKSQEESKSWSICPYCIDRNFKRVYDYAKHVKEEHGECRYQCAYCFYRTAAQTLIELHEKKKHAGEVLVVYKLRERYDINEYRKQLPLDKICLPYVCAIDHCGMKFYTCSNFIAHLTNTHQGLTEYSCIYCQENYPNPSALLKHYLNHNMGLLQCVYCHCAAQYVSVARNHMYVTHPNQPAKVLIRELNPAFRTNRRQYFKDSSDMLYDLIIQDLDLNDYAITQAIVLPNLVYVEPEENASTTKELDYQSNNLACAESVDDPIDVVVISDEGEETTNDSASDSQQNKNVIDLENTSLENNYNNKIRIEDCDEPLVLLRHRNPQTSAIIENAVDPLGTVDDEVLNVDQIEDDNEEINSENIIIKDITTITSPTINTEGDSKFFEDLEKDSKSYIKEVKSLTDIEHTGLAGLRLYKCGATDCTFSAGNLSSFRDHLFVCDITKDFMMFTCFHCKKHMKHMNSLIDHIKTHGTYRYGCSLCSHRGPASSYVSKHMKTKHKVSSTRTIPLNPLKSNHEFDLFVVCPFRKGVQFMKRKNSSDLSSAMWPAAQNINLEDKTVFSPEEINLLPRKPIFPKEVRCSKCSYTTKVRSNMIRHLGAHLNDTAVADSAPVNPVPCLNKNEKMFDKMVNLANSSFSAERKILTAEEKAKLPVFIPEHKRFVCGVKGCSYLTVSEMMLRCHFQALHTEETEYKCPHCVDFDQSPANIDKICAHLRMHEAKLYKCAHCHYHHHQKHLVERHLTERHEGKTFFVHSVRESENTELQTEQSTEPAAILTSVNIPENVESTKDFKPWCCGLCKFKTTNRTNVINHAQASHGVRSQYKCSLCSFKCSYDKNFQGHFDSKHPGQKVEMISVYYKKDCTIRSTQQISETPVVTEATTFDTTPLWKRDMPRIRHIRGILFDEIKTTPKKSTKVTHEAFDPSDSIEETTKSTKVYKKRFKSTQSTLTIDELSSNSTDSNSKTPDIAEKTSTSLTYSKLQYICPICSKFKTKIESDFIDHLFRELKYDRFVCTHCKMTSHSYDVLKKHSEKMHNKRWQPEAIASITPDKNIENQILNILQEQRKRLKPNLDESIGDLNEIIENKSQNLTITSKVTKKIDFDETNANSSTVTIDHNVENDTDDEILIIDESEESSVGIKETLESNKKDEEKHSIGKTYISTFYQCGYCSFIASTSVDVIKHSVKAHVGKEPVLNQKSELKQNMPNSITVTKKTSNVRKRKDTNESDLQCPPAKKTLTLQSDSLPHNMDILHSNEIENTTFVQENVKKNLMYMCQFCPKRGESIEEIFNHWLLIHKDLKANTLRSKIFKYKTVTNEEVERGRTICMLCGFRGKKSTLKNHHATAHADQKPYFAMSNVIPFKSNVKILCKLCDYCAYDLDFIKKHFQSNHPTEEFENVYHEDMDLLSKQKGHLHVNHLQTFKCCYCDEIMQGEKEREYHHNTFHSHLLKRFDACPKVIRFGCPECKHISNSYSSIFDHIRKHAKPFKCSHCDITFRFPSMVKHHSVREHVGLPSNYICLKKPKQFLASLRERIECLFDDGTTYLYGEAKIRKNKKPLTGYDSMNFQKNKTHQEEIKDDMIQSQNVSEPTTSATQSTLPVTCLPTKRTQVAKKSTTLLPKNNSEILKKKIKDNSSVHAQSTDLNIKEEEGYSYYGTKPNTDYTNITTVMQFGSAEMKVNILTLVQLMNIFPKVVVKDLKHKRTCL